MLSKMVTSGWWLASQVSLICFSVQASFLFPVRLSQVIVCVCVLPNLLKKHSQYFSLLNYCNSSIKMEIASSAHGGLERV